MEFLHGRDEWEEIMSGIQVNSSPRGESSSGLLNSPNAISLITSFRVAFRKL